MALARSPDRVSSAAVTPATALVVDSRGRLSATMATNAQNVGATAAVTLSTRPIAQVASSVRRRPWTSASPDSGRLAREARRMAASPSPSVEADSPTCSAMDAPGPATAASPKAAATSPSDAVTAYCANPEATESPAAARIDGCRQPTNRLPTSPDSDGAAAGRCGAAVEPEPSPAARPG